MAGADWPSGIPGKSRVGRRGWAGPIIRVGEGRGGGG